MQHPRLACYRTVRRTCSAPSKVKSLLRGCCQTLIPKTTCLLDRRRFPPQHAQHWDISCSPCSLTMFKQARPPPVEESRMKRTDAAKIRKEELEKQDEVDLERLWEDAQVSHMLRGSGIINSPGARRNSRSSQIPTSPNTL